MIEFLTSAGLWSNIVGGVITAGLIALIAYLWDRRGHRVLKELTDIMGIAIEHRIAGERGSFTDKGEWISEAQQIEAQAVSKANELSSTAGSLVQWLDRVPP